MSRTTSKLTVTPRGSANKPPSGRWRGWYKQGGRTYHFTMVLEFGNNKGFFGSGVDDVSETKLGTFDVHGTWKPSSNTVTFLKKYRLQHPVTYQASFDENFTKMQGSYFHGSGSFEMNFIEPFEDDFLGVINKIKKYSSASEPSPIVLNIRQFYDSGDDKHFDFTIYGSEGLVIRAHKFMLCANSKYFEGFFRTSNTESVTLDSLDPAALEQCVQFIYTEDVTRLDEEIISTILEVADFLRMEILIDICGRLIMERMDLDTCVYILRLSFTFGNQHFQEMTVHFVALLIERVLNTDDGLEGILSLPKEAFVALVQCPYFMCHDGFGLSYSIALREENTNNLIQKYCEKNPAIKLNIQLPCRVKRMFPSSFSQKTSQMRRYAPDYTLDASARKRFCGFRLYFDNHRLMTGLKAFFSNGSTDEAGHCYGGNHEGFMLTEEGERICYVVVHRAPDARCVKSLSFFTNRGNRYGPWVDVDERNDYTSMEWTPYEEAELFVARDAQVAGIAAHTMENNHFRYLGFVTVLYQSWSNSIRTPVECWLTGDDLVDDIWDDDDSGTTGSLTP